MKKLRWQLQQRPMPKHPYRDTALLYGGLAGIVLVIAAVAMVAFFLVAIVWSWWRFRSQVDEGDASR